ncbi:hypothetical protein K474DRAFT_383634 [Panus rudis PR-1116 ss-1]|nr:hypothetical protein K474DRAFT_383634 [Panus rudis PR-1116 ss-1]
MDELVHHCIHELSFDGDLGCNASRLRDFIVDFYAHRTSEAAQKLDDAFCSFVWSVISQQPNVRVGVLAEDAQGVDVYIADQGSKWKDKANDPENADAVGAGLEVIPDAESRSLEELLQQYGDNLRLAVDPETIFVALTGSHNRPSELTPMVYTVLQLVARGRENGISVVDVSKKTGYDAKTCHYIVEKLVKLDFIVKRKKSGVGSNFCIHKYFFERSTIWREVVNEEAAAATVDLKLEDEDLGANEDPSYQAKARTDLNFTPIDMRHLSSLPLVRSRIVKLLKNSPHYMHTTHNLLVTLGYAQPAKTERRFFQTRLRELIAEGLIEKVQVPHAKRANALITCIRLLSPEEAKETEDVELDPDQVEDSMTTVKANLTIQKQVVDLVHASGTEGITINELSAALGNFDRRILELLLRRSELAPPPPHLADLAIAQMTENHGRERRFRYFTLPNYRIIMDRENMKDKYEHIDTSQAGGFLLLDDELFYEDEEELITYVDNYNGPSEFKPTHQTTKGKEPKIMKESKPKTPRKPKVYKNPILPDGSVKKGRPRKEWATQRNAEGHETGRKSAKKRKRDEVEADGPVAPSGTTGEDGSALDAPPPPKKRKGRLPKKTPAGQDAGTTSADVSRATEIAEPIPDATLEASYSSSMPPPPSTAEALSSLPYGSAVTLSQIMESASQSMVHEQDDALSTGPIEPEISAITSSVRDEPISSTRAVTPAATISVDNAADPVNVATGVSEQPTAALADATLAFAKSPTTPGAATNLDTGFAQIHTTDGEASAQQAVPMPMDVSMPMDDIPIDPALLTPGPGTQDEVSPSTIEQPSEMTPAPHPLEGESNKRPLQSAESTPSQRSTKRAKTASGRDTPRKQTNISQARREKEFLRMLEEAGGTLNASTKDFVDAHAAVVEAYTKEGEPTSQRPGTRIDKRTIDTTIRLMEDRGKIKILTTTISSSTGLHRPVRIVHLPDVTEEQLNAYLSELSRNLRLFPPNLLTPVKTLPEPVAYGGVKAKSVAPPPVPSAMTVLDSRKDSDLAERVFGSDDESIRQTLLTERYTLAQLFGGIHGKMARVRELHLITLKLFEEHQESYNVVSHEQRIICLPYYYTELTVATFCSIVPVIIFNEELLHLLQSPEGRQTPVGALSPSIQHTLAASKSRAQARLQDLLEILQHLHVVTPLQPTQQPGPNVVCVDANGPYPTMYEPAPPTLSSPHYWRFHTTAPLYLWALAADSPPLWKEVSISTVQEAIEYWRNLERVCIDEPFAFSLMGIPPDTSGRNAQVPENVVKCLRRSRNWSTSYSLSWYQSEYLRRYIDRGTGATPLQDEDGGESRLARISWIVSAPLDIVRQFYAQEADKHSRDKHKVRLSKQKRKVAAEEKAAKKAAEGKAKMARKAADAKQQREKDWEEIVKRVHPEPLKGSAAIRVKRVRNQYMASTGKNVEKWEREVAKAVEEARIAAKQIISAKPLPLASAPAPPPPEPVVSNVVATERSVDDLVVALRSGPRRPEKQKRKSKKKATEEAEATSEPKEPQRRQRFPWTKEFDELVRDVAAIIHVRCRDKHRDEWGSADQIFPGRHNSARQRFERLLSEDPTMESYMKRLEERWHELWIQNRGTELLPDDDPASGTNFDLVKHVKFLRTHVDKAALRVGYTEAVQGPALVLPSTVEELHHLYNVVEPSTSAPPFDFLWTNPSEESREKQFYQLGFVMEEDLPEVSSYPEENVYVADSTLKMVLGTPNEVYDPDLASAVLKGVGEGPVAIATRELLQNKVLSKLVRDPSKPRPGRTLKISDPNQNALDGMLSSELFQDAATLEEMLEQEDSGWRDWSLFASDGEIAALVQLVSECKLDMRADTTIAQAARAAIDWNSKKADDDDLETAIQIRYLGGQSSGTTPVPSGAQSTEGSVMPSAIPIDPALLQAPECASPKPSEPTFEDVHMAEPEDRPSDNVPHGATHDGSVAACRRSGALLVDCTACLQESRGKLLASLPATRAELARCILDMLQEAGSKGVSKDELRAVLGRQVLGRQASTSLTDMIDVIGMLTGPPEALAFWTGYRNVVLVSATYLASWTVALPQSPPQPQPQENRTDEEGESSEPVLTGPIVRIFPRRWLDIHGRIINDIWASACRAVTAMMVFKPGISQAEIRWRLKMVYDRQEINDILRHLLDREFAIRELRDDRVKLPVGLPDDEEERSTFWMLDGKKHWYTVP